MGINILIAIGGLIAGSFLGYVGRQAFARKRLDTAEGQIEKMTEEAEKKAQETVLNAKNKAVKVLRWRFFGDFPKNTTCALTALSVFRAL